MINRSRGLAVACLAAWLALASCRPAFADDPLRNKVFVPNVAAFSPRGTVGLSVSGTSASAALPAGITAVITNTGSTDAYLAFGDITATATTAGYPLPAGQTQAYDVSNWSYIAAITAGGTTALKVVTGFGSPMIAGAGTANGAQESGGNLDSIAASTAATAANTTNAGGYLSQLATAASSVAPLTSITGACFLALNHSGTFLGASGTVNGASNVFILNKAALPSDPYTPVAGDMLVAPLVIGAAGFWSLATVSPVTASAGVTVCTSSTLYSAGALTKTNVTSTAATNNSITVLAK